MSSSTIFSIMMCTRNSSWTLTKAIDSLIGQSCQSWELLILDNGSDDESWNIINHYMKRDQRIKGKRRADNIGWAKGASVLLKEASGKYTTFLAADDFFINNECLQSTKDIIEQEAPDIIWNGYKTVQLYGKKYKEVNTVIPEYHVYTEKDNKIQEIYEIMHSLYYNSFFHFMKIEFLKENNINFYAPYFADYESMTAAMCFSTKSVIQNKAIYALTLNTSQTISAIIWNENIQQWKLIKQVVFRNNYTGDKLQYIAERILTNHIATIEILCSGGALRDKEMNPIEKTALERLLFFENAMETAEWAEMLRYAGSDYMLRMFNCAKNIYCLCRSEGYSTNEISSQTNWIHNLVEAIWYWDGEQMRPYPKYEKDNFLKMEKALCHTKNNGMFGYKLMEILIPYITDDVLENCQNISTAYEKRIASST